MSTKNTVNRFCSFFNLPKFSLIREEFEKNENATFDLMPYPDKSHQESITDFVAKFSEFSPSKFASDVFQNQQRTSTHNGILKAEAVRDFSIALQKNGVNYFQDLASPADIQTIEKDLLNIKGQGSGISKKYFWMLSGDKNQIKPDRMVCRFVERAIGRPKVSIKDAEDIISGAYDILKIQYNTLNLRLLDYKIWNFQRDDELKKANKKIKK